MLSNDVALKILHVVGARPNYMKIAPIYQQMKKHQGLFQQLLVHTGQHYDPNMSEIFFRELNLPEPNINLNVGSGSHAQQTAQIIERFEPVLLDFCPDWVIVPGDVNSTLACALVAAKLGVKVAHVEAGLRSFDRTMPEEINRVLTDHLSDVLFVSEPSGNDNLIREGIDKNKIFFVGNTMIDTLVQLLPLAKMRWEKLNEIYHLDRFILVTLHRPSNVDNIGRLREIVEALSEISIHCPVIFPVHPRTQKVIMENQLDCNNLTLVEPLGYLDFLCLESKASLVVTDSGGIQEETTFLGVPCLTVRPNTERPLTLTHGTNRLVSADKEELLQSMYEVLEDGKTIAPPSLFLWDGRASERIVKILAEMGK